jgi:hypothetical protein
VSLTLSTVGLVYLVYLRTKGRDGKERTKELLPLHHPASDGDGVLVRKREARRKRWEKTIPRDSQLTQLAISSPPPPEACAGLGSAT